MLILPRYKNKSYTSHDPPSLHSFMPVWKSLITLRACRLERVVKCVNSGRIEDESPATYQQLQVLSSVKEITGGLLVNNNDTDIVDLSFLRNLRVIHGRGLEWVCWM